MKKLNLLIGLLIGFMILSCSSDDGNGNQEPTIAGELIVNGQTYDLTKGFIIPNYTGSDTNYDTRRFYFILTNGDITLDNNDFVYSDNITQLIDFNMYSSVSGSGTVENTTYSNYMWNDPDPNFDFSQAYIDHSGINTNVVIQNNQYVSADSISSDDLEGQATISENNGIYTILFSFSNSQNTISGTFTGSLTDLNYQY
ncbi:MAG TPA: hypothetical protein VKN14_07295 [Flavobacteriaceae bacterium]|nr:hypothetical protein [Flavobacteriaceae bacterium]